MFGGATTLPRLAVLLAWGSVVGSALQFVVQLPVVCASRRSCVSRSTSRPSTCAIVTRNFVPVFVSRGVVQISAYIDALLASLLPTGAVTGLANAQLLYTLPVSLFGMSVAAAELPAMAGDAGATTPRRCALRLDRGLRQIAFFVVPSAVAFLALGDVIAAALLQTGRFRTRTRCTSGASSPARRSGCSPRRSAASTRRPTTRCATPGRRCATRSSASR